VLILLLLVTAPLWVKLLNRMVRRRATPAGARASTVSRNRQTGPLWEQDTPWVLDLEDEEDL